MDTLLGTSETAYRWSHFTLTGDGTLLCRAGHTVGPGFVAEHIHCGDEEGCPK